MSDWYLYDEGGAHRGPVTTEALARSIHAREVAADAWVAPERWFERPGQSGWRHADAVEEITSTVAALRTGGLRIVEGAYTTNRLGSTEFGATVMMVGDSPKHEPPHDDT